MKREAIFRFRITAQEAERLDSEATERGITKADLIREALGWKKAEKAPRSARPAPLAPTQPAEKPIDPARQPGLAAIQELAQRLGGKK